MKRKIHPVGIFSQQDGKGVSSRWESFPQGMGKSYLADEWQPTADARMLFGEGGLLEE